MPSGFAPPYSVAQTIQDILKQRRETSRQAMIDKLSEENVRSEMDYRKGNLTLAQDQYKWGKDKDMLGMVPGGTDPSTVDPLLQELARKVGMIRQRPAQSPTIVGPQATDFDPSQAPEVTGTIKSGVEQPFLPGREAGEEFVGDKDYQQRTRFQEDIDALMGQFKDDPDTLRALMLARNTGAEIPASIAGPKPSFTPINPDTGKAGAQIDLPRGGEADVMPYPPASYTPAFMPWFDPTPTADHPQGRSILVGNRLGAGGQPIVRDMPATPNATGPQQPLQRVAGPDQTPDTGLQTAIDDLRVAASGNRRRPEAIAAARSGILAAASRALPPGGEGHAAIADVLSRMRGERVTKIPTAADVPATIEYIKRNYRKITPAEIEVIRVALDGYLSVPLE